MTQSNTPSHQEAQDVVSLADVLQTLNRYKWPIIGFTAATAILSTLVVFSMTPIYRATAVMEIEQERAKIISIDDIYGIDSGGDSYLNTQYQVLKSRGVIEKVIEQLDLLNNPEYNPSLRPVPWYTDLINWRSWFGLVQTGSHQDEDLGKQIFNSTVNELLKNVDVEPMAKTQIVQVHVTSQNPGLAAAIANAIAESYIDSYLEAKLALTVNATNWMQTRLQELSEKLKLAEQALQDYREQENLVEMEGVLTLSNNELKALTEALVKERNTLTITGNIYQQMQSAKKSGQRSINALPAVLSHPLIQGLKQEEARLERNAQELSGRYGPKHPSMIAAQSELRSIRSNISSQTQNILNSIENEYKVAVANESALNKAVGEAQQRVQDINRKQFRLQALERDVRINKDLYDAFFKRIQETSATSDLQTANARIVDEAFAAQIPVKPKKGLIITIATLLGLLVSCGLAFLLEIMNNTIRSVRDVEDKLNQPVLGVLPHMPKHRTEDLYKHFSNGSEYGFVEAVRTIRTSVNLASLERKIKVFAITSSIKGEGKSIVSSNLAFAMGQLGKVLIIDCDMRRPRLGNHLGMPLGLAGLSSVLSGAEQATDCIHKVASVDVMLAGGIPVNPQELLSNKAFGLMLTELRTQYDTIILDCPPVQSVSDALMVSTVSDGLIYVIEAGRVQAPVIKASIGRLLRTRVQLLGVVLNNVDETSTGRYGYENNYNDNESTTAKAS